MKKLALALVCLVSVAFFASCDPTTPANPEPAIQVLTGENYVYDGQTVDLGTEYLYGFKVSSNAETQKNLTTLRVIVTDSVTLVAKDITVDLTTLADPKNYEFIDTLVFPITRDFVGNATINATVTDEAGEINTASISLALNQPALPLIGSPLTWSRKGGNLQGNTKEEMAKVGLQWDKRDAFHANIRPASNDCKLYVVENSAEAFDAVTNTVEKAQFFHKLIEVDNAVAVDEYRRISVALPGDTDYNDILAVIDAEGNQHLVFFEKANIQTGSYGVWTTITGKIK